MKRYSTKLAKSPVSKKRQKKDDSNEDKFARFIDLAEETIGGNGSSSLEDQKKAVGFLKEATKYSKEDSLRMYKIGVVVSKIPGYTEQAVRYFNAAYKFDPNNASLSCKIGEVLSKNPIHTKDAILFFYRAINSEPNNDAYRQSMEEFCLSKKNISDINSLFKVSWFIRDSDNFFEKIVLPLNKAVMKKGTKRDKEIAESYIKKIQSMQQDFVEM